MKGEIGLLLSVVDDAYAGRSWQGPNLKGSLRGLSPRDAVWRPGPHRHNIWELVMHAAYWKYAVTRRMLNGKRGSFPLKGTNWFVCPQKLTSADWRAGTRLLDELHQSLRRAIASLDARMLNKKMAASSHTYAKSIYGIAAHDIYHTGQITLIKRLMRS